MKKWIYLDNAATTQVHPDVLNAMLPYFSKDYGNPSAIYSFATESQKAVDVSRSVIADLIGAKTNEIYFTAGGSESDNWALKAAADAYALKGKHIITSTIEHHAVLHTCAYLEKHGVEVTYVNVDENGVVRLDELEAAIRPDTILISIMAANNEIGTIQPLKEIGRIAHTHGILFHTDAVQAFGHIPLNVDEMQIDMLSASGHKINGPKGVGILYIRKGVKILSFIHGGSQERKSVSGLNIRAFPSDTALLKALYLSTFEATKKWTMPLRNWGQVYGELSIMYLTVILMLIYTGCRIGELLDLEKKDIHLEDRWFYVKESKTEAGIREVPIAEKVVPFFEYWMQKDCDHLICTPDEEPFKYRNYYDSYWIPLMLQLNMGKFVMKDDKEVYEGHRPHDTRHTCISLMTEKKVDGRIIKKIVGHKGQGVTETVYTHLELPVKLEAINLI